MYHLLEEQMARAQHRERSLNLELEHRQKLAASLRPMAQRQANRARHLSR